METLLDLWEPFTGPNAESFATLTSIRDTLSSLRWKPGSDSRVIASGDYDGVVMEYDLERRVPIFERDEHGGRRVWSVDYSHWDPVIGASGSDDGTMQMWDPRCEGGGCVATVQPGETRRASVAWSLIRLPGQR
ncbi:hypothetical protein GH714_040146 [Hevea brasiliensis]|uniref:Peroxin-7 n=1 Tax=Hevea brasiliensis TaxID=3981 RepID=A0A6A6MP63_HEVBR|nr:hypothetical protein GH714_040146 [Hevea brasiliensis]